MKTLKNSMLFAVLTIMMIAFTGCGDKTALTPDQFKSKMESKGFTVQDATDQFEGKVDKVYIALNKNFQIEFYSVASKDQALGAYNQNKRSFEDTKSAGSTETESNIGNNSKYTLNTNGKYKVVSRIDTTFIYINVPSTYKTEVNTLLKDLGY